MTSSVRPGSAARRQTAAQKGQQLRTCKSTVPSTVATTSPAAEGGAHLVPLVGTLSVHTDVVCLAVNLELSQQHFNIESVLKRLKVFTLGEKKQ